MEIMRPQKKTSTDDVAVVSTIPLYRTPPVLEVRLEDFELFAIDRLRVLKGISDELYRGKKPDEIEEPKAILAEFDLPYKAVSNAELESMKEKLTQVARSLGQPLTSADTVFYKVPFEEVPELVAGRRVYIHKGHAYVAMNQVVSLVVTQFRSNLSKDLILANRKWTSMISEKEKNRLTPIVESLSTSYLGPDYSEAKKFAEISLKDIDQVANSSFPLCMRHLFEKLREDHHLKYGGRMQLGLFLKGVGLTLDDALVFWKSEFSKKVGAERFDKEYAYSIRHSYGKEGKRVDYTPYSCQKVISSTPGVGDHHGCPYRHFSEDNLRAALSKMGVSSRAMTDVMDKVQNKHYQIACTLTFEAIHGSSCDAGINHPNQYFSESQKILQSKVSILVCWNHAFRRGPDDIFCLVFLVSLRVRSKGNAFTELCT
uniref:DNA primase large subunit C-terminal domain-containing protein n=1 Tax=Chenopodium quinoa TaxID=63459 RepID=A0A803L1A8_CHEQI